MSENKFLAKMRGEKAPKSLVEVKNDKFLTPFVGLPKSTDVSHGFQNDAESSVIVANAAKNWGLQKTGLGLLEDASNAVYTGGVNVAGQNAWINLSYTFPTSSDSTNSVVSIINPSSKWVLRLVGKDLFSQNETIGFELVVKIGSTNIANIECTTTRQAGFFCKTFVVDFSDSADTLIKVNGGDKLTVQLFCKDETATACYYTGSSVLSLLERRIDADVVANEKTSFEDLVEEIKDLKESKQDKGDYATNTALSQGLAQKQDVATAINYDNITNCLTEIPQDIKLELVDGVLTLKAGSKVYVPNGAGVYDDIAITNNLTSTFSTNGTHLVGLAQGFGNLTLYINAVSGTTEPTTLSNGLTWYDTANNVIKRAWAGSWQDSLFSLPLAAITISNGVITSIDQVFNGFGYIGSTVFALPGVKGLVPNGRNADGTLRNNERTVSSVLTYNSTYWYNDVELYIGANSIYVSRSVTYDKTNNTLSATNVFCAGKANLTSDFIVKSLTPKFPFRALDYSDTEFIANQVMPSNRSINLTLGASGESYTAPADGWLVLNKLSSGTNYQFVQFYNTKNADRRIGASTANAAYLCATMPLAKGDRVLVEYSATGDTKVFKFIYANGAK